MNHWLHVARRKGQDMSLVAYFLLVLTARAASVHDQLDGKENVLLVIVDDLRPALGCYGDANAHTPNIDRLARRGILFDRAYAQQALCAPSRNSFLTSRRPDTLGLYDFYSYWRDVAGNFTTLPQHLKNNGYTTASFGKVFHPGASSNYNDDSPYSWSETPFHPFTQRFKDAPVCPGANSLKTNNLVCPVHVSLMPNATLPDIETMKAAKAFLNSNVRKPYFLAVGFQKPHIPFKYPKHYLKFHSLDKFSLPDNYEWPSNVSSVAYNPWTDLRQRNDIERLKLDCPWQRIPKTYARKIIQSYYAAVTYIDDLIGELINEIETLGTRNNTIVILTSDHGWSLGEHAEWAKYSNFEVSLRIPLIISIPKLPFNSNNDYSQLLCGKEPGSKCGPHLEKNRIRSSGSIIHSPVELLDLFPTISELLGISVPACPRKHFNSIMPDLCTEGSSLVPLIQAVPSNKSYSLIQPQLRKKGALSQYPRPGIIPTCQPNSDKPRLEEINIMGYTLRTNQYRYTVWVRFSHRTKKPNWLEILAEELYDHHTDSGENHNLANSENMQRIKTDLQKLLKEEY